ncbi:MAG TPA: hypothetical protein VLI54_00945 [Bacillota bacterium]|nr:hypothetical protein [Bacillota bacterium]
MTQAKPHIIVYSHGFGVRKDDRGLFTAIAQAVPDARSVLFHYNPFNEAANTLTAKPLSEQVRKLRKIINNERAEYPGAIIDLVCHSQGCVVAAMLKPRDIRKIIMLTPPDDVHEEVVARQLGARLSTPIDTTVKTHLARSDGSTTVIHPEYWQSLAGIQPVKLYNRLARFTALRLINARHDEVLGPVSFEGLDPTVSSVTLDGNHNFSEAESRKRLLYILQKELAV